ncbi:hypothetical protein K474DRAFT_1712364 [Panus rudis PR-1116 ss-1]|nr:hypothetical protein K474DRAFT_1712364 [Panus rudis PR-1116 ss-1]
MTRTFVNGHAGTGPNHSGSVSSPAPGPPHQSAPGNQLPSVSTQRATSNPSPFVVFADRLANVLNLADSRRGDLHIFGQLYASENTRAEAMMCLQALLYKVDERLESLVTTCESLRKNVKKPGNSDAVLDQDACGRIKEQYPQIWTGMKAQTKAGERRLTSHVRQTMRNSVYLGGTGKALSQTIKECHRKYPVGRTANNEIPEPEWHDIYFVLHVVLLRQFCRDNRELLRVIETVTAHGTEVEFEGDDDEGSGTDDPTPDPETTQRSRKRARTDYQPGKVPRQSDGADFWSQWAQFLQSSKRKWGDDIRGTRWVPYIRGCLASEYRRWPTDAHNYPHPGLADFVPSGLAAVVADDGPVEGLSSGLSSRSPPPIGNPDGLPRPASSIEPVQASHTQAHTPTFGTYPLPRPVAHRRSISPVSPLNRDLSVSPLNHDLSLPDVSRAATDFSASTRSRYMPESYRDASPHSSFTDDHPRRSPSPRRIPQPSAFHPSSVQHQSSPTESLVALHPSAAHRSHPNDFPRSPYPERSRSATHPLQYSQGHGAYNDNVNFQSLSRVSAQYHNPVQSRAMHYGNFNN